MIQIGVQLTKKKIMSDPKGAIKKNDKWVTKTTGT